LSERHPDIAGDRSKWNPWAVLTRNEPRHVLVEALVGTIRRDLPNAVVAVDPPSDLAGRWFIDGEVGGKRLVIEVRPQAGFGLSVGVSGAYGEGPDEVFEDEQSVIARIAKLAVPAK
jgi:hypothetical protein